MVLSSVVNRKKSIWSPRRTIVLINAWLSLSLVFSAACDDSGSQYTPSNSTNSEENSLADQQRSIIDSYLKQQQDKKLEQTAKSILGGDSDENVSVNKSQYERLRSENRRLKSEIKHLSKEVQLSIDSAVLKERSEQNKKMSSLVSNLSKELYGQFSEKMSVLEETLKQFRYKYAVVNGICVGLLESGEKRYIRVRDNACVNIVHIKVNDGKITGILGAVSVEAMNAGIVNMSCDIGKASFHLIQKPCSLAKPNVSTAGKILIEAGDKADVGQTPSAGDGGEEQQ